MTKSDIGGSTFKNNYMKLVDAWGADVVDNCYFSVSPKLTPKSYHCPNVTLNNIIDFYNYGGKDDPFIRTVVLSNVFFKFIYHKKYEKSILKFVMSFNDKLMMIFNSYMMPFTPQPLNTKEYNEICKDAVKFCVDHDYRYSPRIHVDIWGLDKGV